MLLGGKGLLGRVSGNTPFGMVYEFELVVENEVVVDVLESDNVDAVVEVVLFV